MAKLARYPLKTCHLLRPELDCNGDQGEATDSLTTTWQCVESVA